MSELDPDEREAILEELEDLASLRDLFEDRGYRGVLITCAECGDDHFYDWELLKESLEHMLETGEPRMHEPPYSPDPENYLSWEYGRGFLDAQAELDLSQSSAPVDEEADPDTDEAQPQWLGDRSRCPYCRGKLASRATAEWLHCPFCGASFAPLRLVDALASKGWDEEDIVSLMDDCGFEAPPAAGDR